MRRLRWVGSILGSLLGLLMLSRPLEATEAAVPAPAADTVRIRYRVCKDLTVCFVQGRLPEVGIVAPEPLFSPEPLLDPVALPEPSSTVPKRRRWMVMALPLVGAVGLGAATQSGMLLTGDGLRGQLHTTGGPRGPRAPRPLVPNPLPTGPSSPPAEPSQPPAEPVPGPDAPGIPDASGDTLAAPEGPTIPDAEGEPDPGSPEEPFYRTPQGEHEGSDQRWTTPTPVPGQPPATVTPEPATLLLLASGLGGLGIARRCRRPAQNETSGERNP